MSAEKYSLPADFWNSTASLVLGIGNCGRQDDGLGWAVIDRLEDRSPAAHLRRTYQLNLEDADLVHGYRRVLFVDATKDVGVSTFTVLRPEPKMDLSFTSHALSVPALLATTQACFGGVPEVYLLAIRGYEWELGEGLTSAARTNLELALAATMMLCPSPSEK